MSLSCLMTCSQLPYRQQNCSFDSHGQHGSGSYGGHRKTMTEHLLKILIVGDGNVGKSSFVHRYVSGQFNKTYKMTVGVDFSVKLLHWSETEKVRLQLWDIAGQERFISMNRIYYKGAVGCVVMFDVTNSSSFLSCRHWKQDLDNKAMLPSGDSIPCILLANKCDLAQRVVSADSIKEFSKANGFKTWMETSVKENKNIGEAMRPTSI
ncbi:ras-related protein Rab-7L1-like isoform X2 [Parambassis ranga]|uniref:Ras-related protein Rab n=1 Tax=Parambassis ranga TaxID=210632 RepID=A0A6P7IND3_9TELE|nr:ras-related protein Rab-7L1-like isoform X2 [Parambassis ranga]